MNDRLDILFRQYESAFDRLDFKTITGFYTDAFMSAGPKGIIAQNKDEFSQKAQEAASFYRSVGQKSARIISKRMIPICDKYSMVVIRWGVFFEKTGSKPVEFDVSYIVFESDDEARIILFIVHEDEAAAMKKLGILSHK